MTKPGRPHHKCSKCQAHIQSCIYKVFGPCKWMEAEEQECASGAEEQKIKEQAREMVQLQADLLREDDQLAVSIKQDNDAHAHQDHHKDHDYFAEL